MKGEDVGWISACILIFVLIVSVAINELYCNYTLHLETIQGMQSGYSQKVDTSGTSSKIIWVKDNETE